MILIIRNISRNAYNNSNSRYSFNKKKHDDDLLTSLLLDYNRLFGLLLCIYIDIYLYIYIYVHMLMLAVPVKQVYLFVLTIVIVDHRAQTGTPSRPETSLVFRCTLKLGSSIGVL